MKIQPVSFYNYSLTNNVSFNARQCTLPTRQQQNDLKVFFHHIYEYKKGLRNLILTTEKSSNENYIKERLERENIPYIIRPVNEKTINVFFGNEDCIKVVSTFDEKLSRLSPEKDFMLGIMLGYDRLLQCRRYIQRIAKKPN